MRFGSKHIFWLVVLGLFGMMFFSYVDSLYRQYQRDEYKDSLVDEIEEMKGEKSKLEKLLEYVQTDEYKELKAKENLGKKLPGETVVVVPANNLEGEGEELELPIGERESKEQWRIYFFGE